MATPNLPDGYSLDVEGDAARLRRKDGTLVASLAPDAPRVLVERAAWSEHRRAVYAAAGYDEATLDLFEEAGAAVIAGEDDAEAAERYGLEEGDLWWWVEMEP